MDVAKGSIIKPLGPLIHFNELPADQFRVSINAVLPGCEKFDPPSQPPGSDRELELGECPNWPMLWPKAWIRLDDAPKLGGSAPPNPADKATPPAPPVPEQPVEPAVEGSFVQPPSVQTTNKRKSPELTPSEMGNISSGNAFMEGLEPITDLPEDQRGPKRRQFDPASSQHTPDPMPFFTEDQRPNVLSPNTLLNTTAEAVKGPLVQPLGQPAKKARKRHPARKKASSSQPAASHQVVLDKVPMNLRPVHVLGYPILPKNVLKTMSGDLIALHDSILYEEERLMKEANPSYPLWIAKVPKGFGFVDTNPGDAVFLRFDDLFDMFHLRQLTPHVVRLFTLSIAIQVAREQTPGIAIMDPFYMSWRTLEQGGVDREIVTKNVEDFFSANKHKEFCVIPYFAE